MSEQPQPDRPTGGRHTRRLYRTVLSIVIAAIVAAWLPFSIIYIDALTKHTVVISNVSAAHQTAVAGGGQAAPVTTRTS